MTTEDALHRAVAEAPDDDLPRLAYADWLEENGDPARAEVIRTQIELARGVHDRLRRTELRRRAEELLWAHQWRWTFRWDTGRDWERGFPVRADGFTSLAELAAELPALLGAVPVREVCVFLRSMQPGDGVTLAARPELARLRRLELYRLGEGLEVPAAEVTALLASPHLRNLESLEINGLPVTRPGLARIDALPQLRALGLCDIGAGRETAEWLSTTPLAARLQALSLWGWESHVAVFAIAGRAEFGGLTRLSLHDCTVGGPGAQALARARHLRQLRDLGLDRCGVDDRGVLPLSESPYLHRLRALQLSHNDIGTNGAHDLVRSATLHRRLSLDLSGNSVSFGPRLRRALRRRFRKVRFHTP